MSRKNLTMWSLYTVCLCILAISRIVASMDNMESEESKPKSYQEGVDNNIAALNDEILSKDSCNIVKTKQVLIIVEDGLKLQCACGTLLTYGKFRNTEKKLSFHMAHIRDHLCSSRHGLALGWTYQNGKVERYMHPSAKRAFGGNAERSRNLMRKFFGAACSDVNMTDSKDKRENSQSFNKSHLRKQGGASQNIDTRTCPASREVHHAVEDTQKKRERAILRSRRFREIYIQGKEHRRPLSETRC